MGRWRSRPPSPACCRCAEADRRLDLDGAVAGGVQLRVAIGHQADLEVLLRAPATVCLPQREVTVSPTRFRVNDPKASWPPSERTGGHGPTPSTARVDRTL